VLKVCLRCGQPTCTGEPLWQLVFLIREHTQRLIINTICLFVTGPFPADLGDHTFYASNVLTNDPKGRLVLFGWIQETGRYHGKCHSYIFQACRCHCWFPVVCQKTINTRTSCLKHQCCHMY